MGFLAAIPAAVSAVGGLIGGGGKKYAPQGAPIQTPVSTADAQGQIKAVQEQLAQQQAFTQALGAQGGLGKQTDVYGQLQDVVAGRGPNPAQAALANATGANVAQQAALMAGQRGASANAGLIARQAAMQGGNIQQQAAGQAAALQAQQSLGALGQAGNMANQLAAQQIQGNQFMTSAQQAQQQQLLNQISTQNQAAVGSQQSVNQANAPLAAGAQSFEQKLIGGALGGAGAIFGGGGIKLADGGMVPALKEHYPTNEPKSFVARHFKGLAHTYAVGGDVKPMHEEGGHVPGKAKVKGDSPKNDIVPALLSPGEIVIPRSILESKNPAAAAAAFVADILSSKKGKK